MDYEPLTIYSRQPFLDILRYFCYYCSMCIPIRYYYYDECIITHRYIFQLNSHPFRPNLARHSDASAVVACIHITFAIQCVVRSRAIASRKIVRYRKQRGKGVVRLCITHD